MIANVNVVFTLCQASASFFTGINSFVPHKNPRRTVQILTLQLKKQRHRELIVPCPANTRSPEKDNRYTTNCDRNVVRNTVSTQRAVGAQRKEGLERASRKKHFGRELGFEND